MSDEEKQTKPIVVKVPTIPKLSLGLTQPPTDQKSQIDQSSSVQEEDKSSFESTGEEIEEITQKPNIPSIPLQVNSTPKEVWNTNLQQQQEKPKIPTLNLNLSQLKISKSTTNSNSSTPSSQTPNQEKRRSQKQKQGTRVKVDFLLTDLCKPFSIGSEAEHDERKLQAILREKILPNHKNQDYLEFFKLTSLEGSGGRKEIHVACKANNSAGVDVVKKLLYQNKLLKIKLEKASQALSTYEAEKKQMQKEIKQLKSLNALLQKEVPQNELLSEIQSLRAKAKQHEKLRFEMLQTVQSLKQQYEALIQVILNQK